MVTAAIRSNRSPARTRRRSRSPFFTLLGLLLLVLAIGGFWPQYFIAAIGGTPEPTTRFWLIHLHAALFVAWLVAYIVQSALVLSGRTAIPSTCQDRWSTSTVSARTKPAAPRASRSWDTWTIDGR